MLAYQENHSVYHKENSTGYSTEERMFATLLLLWTNSSHSNIYHAMAGVPLKHLHCTCDHISCWKGGGGGRGLLLDLRDMGPAAKYGS